MNPQDQAELDALMQQPKYTMHGQWHKSPDVVECVKLANMLHSEFVIREDIAFILMLSSVITCPSMTSLFRDLLKSALLQQQNTDDPRDAALARGRQEHAGRDRVCGRVFIRSLFCCFLGLSSFYAIYPCRGNKPG